jgi:eukaryotic-like serine/threonine-protein kinase
MALEGEPDGTLPPDDAVEMPPLAGGSSLARWDRYELLDLLGKGGMGMVYRARDRRLGRIVAIKFLRGADPDATIRFLREARAQARIDHPHVCRVYEVGEIEGRAYIAIQYVDGEPLHVAARQMPLEAKVAVLRDVAMAIHEAHRLGIVHRDVKPANIMVERTQDERWVPIVTDFGLAREATVEIGLTASGAVIGTPAYMSPEQARGNVDLVDRRSDVYGLGATLYELLTGRPPFRTSLLVELLAQVIHDDPPAPRGLVPSTPIDLEIIALQCLAKDPAQRYPSARALADDLGRYLGGEPILGRRASWWQRLRLRARRHRTVVVLGASSLAITIALAAFGVHAWLVSRSERARTAARTELAERLGRDAKDIELSLRGAYLLPLHDIRAERDSIRQRMASIATTSHDLGPYGDAAIHDALGRGHIALHEWREADDELARAAAAGLATPELHAARGGALGELYHRALEEARRSGDRTWLLRRQHELEQQYLSPALAELAKASASTEGAPLLQAMVALYRRDFATAEKLALDAVDRAPGLFEARKFGADAAYEAASDAFDHGDYDGARPGLERATALYAQASEIARSDASAYEAAAQAWLQRAEIDVRQGRDAREALEHALDLADRALRADSDDATAYTTKAHVLLRWYRTPALRDHPDPRQQLDRLAQTAARAVGIDAGDARAWDALGNAHVYLGIYEAMHGGRGAPWLHGAFAEFQRALAIQPNDPWANNDLGTAHRWLGSDLQDVGDDPMPEYRAALASYERAAAIDPDYVYAWWNQADIHESIAEYQAANRVDPRAAVDAARHAGERCLAVDRSFEPVLGTMALAEISLARYQVETGGSPSDALARAGEYLDRSDALHPGDWVTWFYRAAAAGAAAAFQLREDHDPSGSIAAARAALREAVWLSPGHANCRIEAARLDLMEAAWAPRAGRAAAPLLADALADAERAVALDEHSTDARSIAARACLQIAAMNPSPAIIDRGIDHAERALQRNPQLSEAQVVIATLLLLRAP